MYLIAIVVIIAVSSFVYLAQTAVGNMEAQERLTRSRILVRPNESTSCFRSCMDKVSHNVENVPTCALACKV